VRSRPSSSSFPSIIALARADRKKEGVLRGISPFVRGSNPRDPTTRVRGQLLAFSEYFACMHDFGNSLILQFVCCLFPLSTECSSEMSAQRIYVISYEYPFQSFVW
jgi:hypothetical protein